MAARRPLVRIGWRCVHFRSVAVDDVDDGFAAVELAGRLEQDRDLLGAVQVHRPSL
jgi:hypothetical protein